MTEDEQNHLDLQPQISHPVQEYDEARVEKLMQQIQEARRFQWPSNFQFNV